MSEPRNGLSADLALRLLVIVAAFHLACAWMQTLCAPWPLADAFDLAGSFEEQLLQSLGVSLSGLKEALRHKIALLLAEDTSQTLTVDRCVTSKLGHSGASFLPFRLYEEGGFPTICHEH